MAVEHGTYFMDSILVTRVRSVLLLRNIHETARWGFIKTARIPQQRMPLIVN